MIRPLRPTLIGLALALGCKDNVPAPTVRPTAGPSPTTSDVSGANPLATDAPTSERVRQITAEQLNVEAGKLQPETSLADLGADELDLVELVMQLEDEFDIAISNDALEKMQGTRDFNAGMKNVTLLKLTEYIDQERLKAKKKSVD